jgi:hypothetical protein
LNIKQVNTYLSSTDQTVLLVLADFGIGMTAVYYALIWSWREECRIKFGQRRFLNLMLIGTALVYCGIIFQAFDPSWTCMCVLTCVHVQIHNSDTYDRAHSWFHDSGFCITFRQAEPACSLNI